MNAIEECCRVTGEQPMLYRSFDAAPRDTASRFRHEGTRNNGGILDFTSAENVQKLESWRRSFSA